MIPLQGIAPLRARWSIPTRTSPIGGVQKITNDANANTGKATRSHRTRVRREMWGEFGRGGTTNDPPFWGPAVDQRWPCMQEFMKPRPEFRPVSYSLTENPRALAI